MKIQTTLTFVIASLLLQCVGAAAIAADNPTTNASADATGSGTDAVDNLANNPAADNDNEIQTLVINNIKDPDWKTYRAFISGLDAYEKEQQLAPTAPLRFILRPRLPNASHEGVALRIVGSNTSIAIPIAKDGTFSVPRDQAAADEDADMRLNRKQGAFRWRPDIHSPDVPPNARRLGDLRLECAVQWAIEQYEVPFLIRKLQSALGGVCHSSAIKVDYISSRPITAMHLSAEGRRITVPRDMIESNGYVYVAPVNDTSWPDDALLEFEFATPLPSTEGKQ